MTLKFFTGAETGDFSFTGATSGGVSVSSAIKRTGDYSFRINSSAAASRIILEPLNSSGIEDVVGFGDGVTLYLTFYFRVATLPGSASTFVVFGVGGTLGCALQIDGSGNITLYNGSTSSSTIATVTADGNWHRADFKYIDNGTCEGKIDGAGTQTLTAANPTGCFLYLGSRHTNVTYDIYYDDIVIDDAGYTTTPAIVRMDADGAGTDATGWTIGTGSTYTEVDEVPNDGATTQWKTSTVNDVRGVTLESASSAGVVGTIAAVMAVAIVKGDDTTAVSDVRLRSGSSVLDTAGATGPGSTYVGEGLISTTDPATSAAWTSGGLDSAQVAIKLSAAVAVSGYCTALYLMVLSDGVAAGASFIARPNRPISQAVNRAGTY